MHINAHPTHQIVPAQENSNVTQNSGTNPRRSSTVQLERCPASTVLPYSVLVALTSRRLGARCGEGHIHFEAKGAKGANERTNGLPWSKTLLVII